MRDVLRLGAHQLLATRVGRHAAVATSVDLAKDVCGPRPSGFVNAVLRRVATRDLDAWIQIVAPDRPGPDRIPGRPAQLSALDRRRVPRRTRRRRRRDRGRPRRRQRQARGSPRPHPAAGAAPGQPPAGRRADPLVALRLPAGRRRPGAPGRQRPGGRPGRGQPAGRARPGPGRPGRAGDQLWLDLCAGPGGKARLLSGLAAARGARLVASDVRPHRARRVLAALRRAGGEDLGVLAADGRQVPWRPGTFDRVLADVPCSGLGSLRRRPEARWRKTPADVAGLAGLQRELLDAAIDSVRPGGVVAYVTCSPHLAETREVVTAVAQAGTTSPSSTRPPSSPRSPACAVPDASPEHPQVRPVLAAPPRHGRDLPRPAAPRVSR